MSEERKVLKTLEKDQKTIEEELQKLRSLASAPVNITVKDPRGGEGITVKARRLRDREITAYLRQLKEINPALVAVKYPEDLQLPPEDQEKLYDVMDKTIELATGIPAERLAEIGDIRIRSALLKGIMKASTPSEEELEDLKLFRGAK